MSLLLTPYHVVQFSALIACYYLCFQHAALTLCYHYILIFSVWQFLIFNLNPGKEKAASFQARTIQCTHPDCAASTNEGTVDFVCTKAWAQTPHMLGKGKNCKVKIKQKVIVNLILIMCFIKETYNHNVT